MPPPPSRLRRLWPDHGPAYELFDTSLYLLWLAAIGYVVFPATPALAVAVGAPLGIVSEHQLGWVLGLLALVGVVTSWSDKWRRVGYFCCRFGAGFMALNFIATIVRIGLDRVGVVTLDPEVDSATVLRAALIYLMVYGWAFRRLARDNG